jgi:hypothetical protein
MRTSPARLRTHSIGGRLSPLPKSRENSFNVRPEKRKSVVRLKLPSIRLKKLIFLVFGIQIVFLIFNFLVGNFSNHGRSIYHDKRVSKDAIVTHSEVPGWLLFRSVRSAILLAERELSADLRVLDYDQDIKINNLSCSDVGARIDLACNISLEIMLAAEEHLSASDNLYETATRPLNLEEYACTIHFMEDLTRHHFGSTRQNGVLTHVSCQNLHFSESSRMAVVLASENLGAIAGWIKEAEISEIPFHISVVCPVDKLSAIRSAIITLAHSSGICVIVSQNVDANMQNNMQTICNVCTKYAKYA